MVQRKPVVCLPDGFGEMPSADTIPVPAYGASGILTGCKLWQGEATTDATGAWSVSLASAAFTAAPRVTTQALSTATTLNASASAVLTARSATAASGFVNLPATIAIGGLGDQRAGAGIVVMVLAIGA